MTPRNPYALEQVRECCENNMSVAEIAKVTGLHQSTIRQYLAYYHLEARVLRHKIPPKEEIEELCKALSRNEIAEHYDVNYDIVRAWLRKYGLEAVHKMSENSRKHLKVVDMDEVLAMIRQGMSLQQIASHFDMTEQTLRKRLREYGIDYKTERPQRQKKAINGVNCLDHPKYSRTCEYGSGQYCMYILAGNGRRPCPSWDCTCYKKKNGRGMMEKLLYEDHKKRVNEYDYY